MKYKRMLSILSAAAVLLAGCAGENGADAAQTTDETAAAVTETEGAESSAAEADSPADTAVPMVDSSKWNYNEEDGVYWQVGIAYCANPVDLTYETMGIFVPEAYFDAEDNGDGTYTCSLNGEGTVGAYTAGTAPIVIPVNTPGYMSMTAPTDYVSSASQYTDAGFVYVNAGCRGRNEGAPAGVADLKAAVRYLRYHGGSLPGSLDRIFTFGMSGGGAQSALMGVTGDSELYTPYLEAIGAVMGVSDAIAGAMCWCPITNLDYADAAYEWNLGVTRTGLSEEMQTLSDGLAEKFAEYVNELELKDGDGNVLVLEPSESGIYQAGSYYEYIKEVIETSLNHFLEDTEFPYTTSAGGRGGFGGGPEGAPEGRPDMAGAAGHGGGRPEAADEAGTDAAAGAANGFVDENGQFQNDGINRGQTKSEPSEPTTYETVEDYIASLNAEIEWVIYDSAANTASITSVEDFVRNCKQASKSLGAFDDLEGTQGENTLFGYGDGAGAHFDAVMAELLKDDEDYGAAYAADLEKTDFAGNTVGTRVDMYNPMYYLCGYYDGYGTSNVAKYWRIRTGINQSDTALSTEVNLTLALENYGREVDFETVWGMEHTMAERTGSAAENFIEWVNESLADGD